MSLSSPSKQPRWLVRRDIDGFFGLALDNFIQILLIVGLCQGVLQFPAGTIYGRILPGVALSLMVGNFYYSWLAYRQARAEGRNDLTALPYGINTVSLFAYIFLVMLPVKLGAIAQGMSPERAAELAWQAGLVACLGSGAIELAGAVVGEKLRQLVPRAALLSTLAGIALTFIAIGFLFRTFAAPIVGLVPLSVILPMGLFNLIGSLQNLESAEAAGDRYPTAPALAANGIGTIIAALCGSCFPTTIYIGHPGWKEMGARIGYSVLNGVLMGLLCLTGSVALFAYFVPVEAGMAIVLWIGIVIVVQSFAATPARHAPAVVVGMLPAIAGWGALIAKNALRVGGVGTPDRPLTPAIVNAFKQSDTYIHGAFALEQGFIFSAMLLAAMTVAIIDRQFWQAAIYAGICALLSFVGLMHSYRWTLTDTVINLGWGAGTEWAIGYLLLAILFIYAAVINPRQSSD